MTMENQPDPIGVDYLLVAIELASPLHSNLKGTNATTNLTKPYQRKRKFHDSTMSSDDDGSVLNVSTVTTNQNNNHSNKQVNKTTNISINSLVPDPCCHFGTPTFTHQPDAHTQPNEYALWVAQRIRHTMRQAPFYDFRVGDLYLSLGFPSSPVTSSSSSSPAASSLSSVPTSPTTTTVPYLSRSAHERHLTRIIDLHDLYDIPSSIHTYVNTYNQYLLYWIDDPQYVYRNPVKAAKKQHELTTRVHVGWKYF